VTDTFSVATSDGGSAQVVITITGTNDAATVGDASDLTLVETDAVLSTSGTISISDADDGEAQVQAFTDAAGDNNYGTFTVDADGNWSFTANSAFDELNAGDEITDTITVTSADGTDTGVITVKITGTNDAPTLAAVTSGSISEDDQASTTTDSGLSGSLSGVDIDSDTLTYGIDGGVVSGDNVTLAGTYGTLTVNTSTGAYNYEKNSEAIEALVATETDSDRFTMTVSDGDGNLVTQSFTVNVTGADDSFFVISSGLVRVSDVGGSVQYLDLTESGSTQTAASQNILLNLSNLNSFVSVQSGYLVENESAFDSSLILPIDDLPDGNGSGSITLTVLDGDNLLRSSAERKLELSIDLEWTDGVVTAPEQTIQGYVINDTINADPETEGNEFIFSFEIGGGAVSVTEDGSVAINLAQVFSYVSTLKDVDSGKAIFDMTGSASDYSLSISTSDVPLLRADTDSQITNFETGLSIIDGLAINNADAEVFAADEIVIAGDDGADEISGQSGETEFLLGLGGADVFVQDLSGAVLDEAKVDVVADFVKGTDQLKLTDGESAIAFADLQIDYSNGDALLSLSEGGNSLHLLLLEDIDVGVLGADDFI
jgi:VCBS repeat-containing protein